MRLIIVILLSVFSANLFAAEVVTTPRTEVRLVSEAAAVSPGASFGLGLRFKLKKGWHSYWKNPGDSGAPVTFTWKPPAGVRIGDLRWPAPKKFETPPFAVFGYEDEVLIFAETAVDPSVAAGASLIFDLEAKWLVCEKSCIPEKGTFSITVPVGPTKADAKWGPVFSRARTHLPRPLNPIYAEAVGDSLDLILPSTLTIPPDATPVFFPERPGWMANAAAQALRTEGGFTKLRLAREATVPADLKDINGVLVIGDRSYDIKIGGNPWHSRKGFWGWFSAWRS